LSKDFRDEVPHEAEELYVDVVDYDILGTIVTEDFPPLASQIAALLWCDEKARS
jgi:hypothetical protein